jgi:hypothetical protein
MLRRITVFHRCDRDPKGLFRIKNACMRKLDDPVELPQYRGDVAWTEFLRVFCEVHRKTIIESGLVITPEDTDFVALYKDPLTGKDIIISDLESIINLIKE